MDLTWLSHPCPIICNLHKIETNFEVYMYKTTAFLHTKVLHKQVGSEWKVLIVAQGNHHDTNGKYSILWWCASPPPGELLLEAGMIHSVGGVRHSSWPQILRLGANTKVSMVLLPFVGVDRASGCSQLTIHRFYNLSWLMEGLAFHAVLCGTKSCKVQGALLREFWTSQRLQKNSMSVQSWPLSCLLMSGFTAWQQKLHMGICRSAYKMRANFRREKVKRQKLQSGSFWPPPINQLTVVVVWLEFKLRGSYLCPHIFQGLLCREYPWLMEIHGYGLTTYLQSD